MKCEKLFLFKFFLPVRLSALLKLITRMGRRFDAKKWIIFNTPGSLVQDFL